MNGLLERLRLPLPGIVTWVLLVAVVTPRAPCTCSPAGQHSARILIIRGITNVFSLGLDTLACELTRRGYRVDVTPPSLAPILAQEIAGEYLRDPSAGPLVIIGHSMGGRHCCSIPWVWREKQIPVKLVVILDSNPGTAVPDNVERCVNLYVTNNLGIFHGQAVWSVDPRTDLVNVDVASIERPPGVRAVDHFNIDDSDWIRAIVLGEVERSLASHNVWRTMYRSANARPYRSAGQKQDPWALRAHRVRQTGATEVRESRAKRQVMGGPARNISAGPYQATGSSRK